MPDTNTSKMTAFMVAAKALVETVSGVGAVIIMGQRDAVEVFARAKSKASGQVVTIQPVGGNNPATDVAGPRMDNSFQIHIYDHPGLRKKLSPHGFELCEQIMRTVHKANTQALKSACQDCLVLSWNIEQEGGADIYVIPLQVNFHFSPL
tara:strand:- start:3699 stop:4148 length:450 start_codon:yes stop_codon:yes gene_type:complete